MKTFSPEFKAFTVRMYRDGYKIHNFSDAYHISTRTVKKILNKAGVITKYQRFKGKKWFTYEDHINTLRQRGKILLEWIKYKQIYNIFDLDAVCKGEKPP